jgi:hypothetical protein
MAHYLPTLKKEVFDSVFFIDLIKEYCINPDNNPVKDVVHKFKKEDPEIL